MIHIFITGANGFIGSHLKKYLQTYYSNYILHTPSTKELDLTKPLAERNIVSKIELYKLERSVNELKGELSAVPVSFSMKASADEAVPNGDLDWELLLWMYLVLSSGA